MRNDDGRQSIPAGPREARCFGGHIDFTIDETNPLDVDVRYGRDKKRKLRELP